MKLLILSGLVLSLLGCGTAGGVKYNDAAVNQVHKVGIVSFTLLQAAIVKDDPRLKGPKSPSGMKSFVPGINTFVKVNPQADAMLKEMKAEIESKKKWKVADIDQMKTNPAYTTLFTDKMHNWKNKIAPKEDTQFMIVEGLLDDEAGKKLSQADRDQLMQSLDVDSLAMIKVDVELKSPSGSFNGIAARKPSATTYLVVYSKGIEKPIWEAYHEVTEGEKSIGVLAKFLDQGAMNDGSLNSAKKSLDELLVIKKIEK